MICNITRKVRASLCTKCYGLPDGRQKICSVCSRRIIKQNCRHAVKAGYRDAGCGGYGYRERNNILSVMGYRHYKHYLNSSLWRSIRNKVMQRDKYTCRKCGSRASQVHHMDYKKSTLDGSDVSGLVAVCNKCHHGAEFADGRKVSQSKANRRLI